jgi:hypothetical protein
VDGVGGFAGSAGRKIAACQEMASGVLHDCLVYLT